MTKPVSFILPEEPKVFVPPNNKDIPDILDGLARHPADENVAYCEMSPYLAGHLVYSGHLKAAFVKVESPLFHMSEDDKLALLHKVHQVGERVSGERYKFAQTRFRNGQHIIDFHSGGSSLEIENNADLPEEILAEIASELPPWLFQQTKLISDILTNTVKAWGLSPTPRIRAIPPNSGHEGFISKFHLHGLTAQFGMFGGATEWIAGEVDQDVPYRGDASLSSGYSFVLPRHKAFKYRREVNEIPMETVAIFGNKVWHKSSSQTKNKGQLIAEALFSIPPPQPRSGVR